MRYRSIIPIVAAAGLVVVAGSTAAGADALDIDVTSAVPAVRTIDYLRSIDSVREYTKPKSFFGKLLEVVAGPAEEATRLVRPFGVTNDSLGRVLVADPGQRVVHIFDFEKQKYAYLKGGRRREPFVSPVGVAVDAEDNIYASDSARARVYVFNKQGKFQRAFGESGRGLSLLRPTGLAIDSPAGLIYLADTLRHQVLVLKLDGTQVRTIGRRGTGPGEFNFPVSLALVRGALYVVDSMNFRVQSLTAEGAFLRSFGRLGNQTGTLNRPKGIAADSDGNLYVVDALFEAVQVFDGQGRLLDYFGSGGTGVGQFTLPAGIYIDPRDRIFIADSYNRRIQVFRSRREAR